MVEKIKREEDEEPLEKEFKGTVRSALELSLTLIWFGLRTRAIPFEERKRIAAYLFMAHDPDYVNMLTNWKLYRNALEVEHYFDHIKDVCSGGDLSGKFPSFIKLKRVLDITKAASVISDLTMLVQFKRYFDDSLGNQYAVDANEIVEKENFAASKDYLKQVLNKDEIKFECIVWAAKKIGRELTEDEEKIVRDFLGNCATRET